MDTIPGSDLVEGKTTADKTDPAVPDKTKVDDPTKLSDVEKDTVKQAIEEANKDKDGKSTLPEGAEITVGDDGTATIKYPDKSVDTIPGSDLVEGKTTADKTDSAVPDKTKVDDPTKLSDAEKETVKQAVEETNKDKDGKSTLPEGAEITVGDDGTATIKYPDKSVDTITGKDLVEGKTDAEKINPIIPDDKVKVDDATKLTDKEKEEIVQGIVNANKDEEGKSTLPTGTEIDVTDNGTVTIKYPDGSKTVVLGDKVVEEKTDAEKNQPIVPGTKVTVNDPKQLTDAEKDQVKVNVEQVSPGG